MSEGVKAISVLIASFIGLAIVAVIVSKNAQTGTVLTSAGTALSGVISAAVSPVSNTTASASSLLQATGLNSTVGAL